MLAIAGRAKRGAVRIEYVVAGVICAALLSGMTAVLIVRFGGGNGRPVRVAIPTEQPRETSRQQPAPPAPSSPASPNVVVEVPSSTVEIPAAPKTADSSKPIEVPSSPMVVVIPSSTPPSGSSAQPRGATKAYPSGVAPVLAQGATLRLEAEDFDGGGEGSAYHDTTQRNDGGAYRGSDGVDIQSSNDSAGGGYVVNSIRPGEWWQYTIRVQEPGDYELRMRVSRAAWGDAKARMRVDGFDKTGEILIPSTGSLSSFRTVNAGTVQITSIGTKVLRIEAISGDWDLNWIELGRGGSSGNGVVVVQTPPPVAAPSVVVEIPGGSSTPASPTKTTPSAAPIAGLSVVADDSFAADKVNAKPSGDQWSWGGAGSITIQTLPNETEKSLRLVDTNRTGDTWAKRTFGARKERVSWTGKVRFGPSADGVGITLMDGDKPAAIAYIKNGEFGAEGPNAAFTSIKEAQANTWYDLRVDIDIKSKNCTYDFDGTKKTVKMVKDVPQINAWAVMGAGPTIGTVYVSSVKVAAK